MCRHIREVKEETGIDTEFVEILGFRRRHRVAFEKSDLFFECVLRPLSHEITIQVSEIEAVDVFGGVLCTGVCPNQEHDEENSGRVQSLSHTHAHAHAHAHRGMLSFQLLTNVISKASGLCSCLEEHSCSKQDKHSHRCI